MPETPISFPFGGRSDADAHSDQAPLTTRQALNVRARNPKNGRMQGAQRAGLAKVNSMVLGSGKIKELCTIVGDNRKVTYAQVAGGSEVETAFPVLPGKGVSRAVAVDRFANVYALDGNAGLVKFNSSGEKVWELAIPVTDPNHVIRALWVEPDLLNVYVGVSEGGQQSKATVWAYRQLLDNKTEEIWSLELGWYVEQLKVVGDQLYTAQNSPERRQSRIQVFQGLEAASGPSVAWTQRDNVPYPINGMDVNAGGAVFLAVPEGEAGLGGGLRSANLSRNEYWDPAAVNLDVSTAVSTVTGFTPGTLWAHYRAEETRAEDISGAVLEEGGSVIKIRDLTGNGRDYTPSSGDDGPTWTRRGIGGRPAWRFNGTDQSMTTGGNPDISRSSADRQQSMFPAYEGSVFHVWVVMRPANKDAIGCVLYQENEHAASSNEISLWANRDERDSVASTTPTAGTVSLFDDTTFGTTQAGGTDDQPFSGVVDSQTDGVLVHFTVNGDITGVDAVFRVNGAEGGSATITAYDSAPWESTQPTLLGKHGVTSGVYFEGEISEIVVIRGESTGPSDTEDGEAITGLVAVGAGGCAIMEGILAWRYGIYRPLPTGGSPHAFGVGGSPFGPPGPTGTASAAHGNLASVQPILAKYAPGGGEFVWSIRAQDTPANEEGGIGYGVVVGEGDDVFSAGPTVPSAAGYAIARKVIDEGDSVSISSGDGAWFYELTSEASPDYAYPRMAVDEFGNLYLPLYETDETFEATLKILDRDGNAGAGVEKLSVALAGSQHGHAVALHPDVPDYTPDAVDVAEFVFLGTDNGGDETVAVVHKVQIVTTTPNDETSPRTRANLGVINNGSVRRFYLDGTTAHTDPTGGTSALSAAADYIQCTPAFIKVGAKRRAISECAVFVDGTQPPKVYTLRDDAVTTLEAKTAGEIPQRPRLVEFWRQRLVILSADDAHLLSMSAIGDIQDWDFAPPEPLATSAVRLSLQRAGSFSDVVNAFAPVNDDLALVGGDHSLWILRGDPRDGGQFDRVTSSIGMAFGRPYCLAPDGSLYFWGIPSGLYRYVPGGGIERLSIQTLDDTEFRDLVDLSTHYIRLFYSDEFKCVWVFQFPYGGAVEVRSWCIELKTHKAVGRPPIWGDSFSRITQTPTAGMVVDGDNPTDRVVVVGCVDGFLRKFDRDSADDDGTAIDSYFVTPWISEGAEKELMLTELTAEFSTTLEGMRYELFASQEAELLGPVQKSGSLGAGRNRTVRDRVGGAYLAVRMRNAQLGETWALERMTANIEGKGRRRAARGR